MSNKRSKVKRIERTDQDKETKAGKITKIIVEIVNTHRPIEDTEAGDK